LLIWLMSYLLHYWFVVVKRIFLFVLFTFVYLAILDSFTVYDASLPMVRTFIISLIAFGLLHFVKEINREKIRFPRGKKTAAWLISVMAVVLLASAAGYASPKYAPQWPDPVPFIKNRASEAGFAGFGLTIQKVGYGTDDS